MNYEDLVSYVYDDRDCIASADTNNARVAMGLGVGASHIMNVALPSVKPRNSTVWPILVGDGSNNSVVFRKAEFLHDWYGRIYLRGTSKYQAHGVRHLQNRFHEM